MAKPPPDPLFVFHEGMDSVFCLLFVLDDCNETIYAGTGDGNVHIWDLKDNRRLEKNKIGNNTCLQLHQTGPGQFITQEKSGPTILWKEDAATRRWTKHRVIPSSYVGFCRSVLTQDMSLVVPCSGSTLKVICLQDEGKNLGCVLANTGKTLRYRLGDSEKTLRHELGDSEKSLPSELGDSVKTSPSELGDTGKTSLSGLGDHEKTSLSELGDHEKTSLCKLGYSDKILLCELGDSEKTSLCKLGYSEKILPCELGDSEKTSRCKLGDSEKTSGYELGEKASEEKYLCCEKDEQIGEVMALKTFDQFLLALYEAGQLKLWSISTKKCLASLNLFDKNKDGETDCPMTLDYDKKSCRGIVGSSSAELIEFSCENSCELARNSTVSITNPGTRLVKNRTISMTNPGASCVKIREDGKLFVVGCWDGRIRLYSFKTFKLLAVLDSHRRKTVQDVVFAAEPVRSWSSVNLFASGGLDGRLCLWSVY